MCNTITIDSESEIALAQLGKLLSQYCYKILLKNGEG